MKRLISTSIALVLAVTLFSGMAAAQGDIPSKLVLGMVPSREADAIVDSLDPIAAMLSERLVIPVETFVSTNFVGLVEAVGTGRVDIGLFGPAALVQAVDNYGAEVILASVRQGATSYRAQFNVRCDSGITTFEQLRGKTIAFVDPGSASGYQFPFVTLKTTYGIDPNTEMTSIFAGSHDASALAVYNGDVDVSVTFGGSPGSDGRETIEGDYPDVKDVVCILGYSDYIPNDGAVVRKGLDPQLVEQITQALIDIANTPEGKALTSTLFNVTEFARVDASAYDIVREVSKTFQR
ncbi:MAG: phosphate/phosphite/phosphonate ABC transporter substrate-binding protein [Trueperaceae bacterium]|nr:phosphate/phosphite/phosphonate ABC transporter substrate-binding protein [Trueperaceae bacterium]MCC6311979.1 phosphate/phosphite/phosphonate ABC transporter substrate-binding protein [Trueperaceae bacterium]MCO5174711.1 phosphate/phosphite/phosphonate ABC transporter substrate-binding protein [Trueperaceae bacterium]